MFLLVGVFTILWISPHLTLHAVRSVFLPLKCILFFHFLFMGYCVKTLTLKTAVAHKTNGSGCRTEAEIQSNAARGKARSQIYSGL